MGQKIKAVSNTCYISRSYYHGWILNKISPWRQKIDRHILLLQQVNIKLGKCSDTNIHISGRNRSEAKEETVCQA